MGRNAIDISSIIFNPKHKGRMFTMLRHPIHRAASLFYYTQDTSKKSRRRFLSAEIDHAGELTIEEYFQGGRGENNWLVRYLANVMERKLTDKDLDVAKEVLRRKVLVGLLEEKSESMMRFSKMFGWRLKEGADSECHEMRLQWAWTGKHRHSPVEEGSDLWNLIMKQNEFDMKLYDYAVELFKEQRRLFE